LRAMITLKEAFKLPVGYSDHTDGIEIPVAAVSLGACIIEKHFTLDRNMIGPDHKASLEPEKFKTMVKAIRNVEKSLGDGIKKPTNSELQIKEVVRKKLVAAHDMEENDVVMEGDITFKRAKDGLSPELFEIIIGKKLLKPIKKDEGFTLGHFMIEKSI